MGFIPKEEGERGYFGGMVGGGVVLEFSGGEEVGPGFGVVGAKDSEISFNLLVSAFGLSIGLRMVGGGETDVVMEESGEFPSEGRGELGSTIGD